MHNEVCNFLLEFLSDFQKKIKKIDCLPQKEGAECVILLTRIGRKEQAVRYYEAWLSSRIGQLWKEALTEKAQAADVLDEFYRLLSQLWNHEVRLLSEWTIKTSAIFQRRPNAVNRLRQFRARAKNTRHKILTLDNDEAERILHRVARTHTKLTQAVYGVRSTLKRI